MLPKKKVKIPHMGWNNLDITNKDSKILSGIENEAWVYFVHSYYIVPVNKDIIVAKSNYGKDIPVVIEKDNIFGTQFHPEKSGNNGEKIIKNFLNVCDNKK
jgi:glutamine amidotransferase